MTERKQSDLGGMVLPATAFPKLHSEVFCLIHCHSDHSSQASETVNFTLSSFPVIWREPQSALVSFLPRDTILDSHNVEEERFTRLSL